MINFDSRYFGNAHRISDVALSTAVTTLYDGQWLMKTGDVMEIATGALNSKSYLTLSRKYGSPVNNIGAPITADPSGRDNVTSTGRVTVLVGPFRLATDMYLTTTGAYTNGTALKVDDSTSSGKLTQWISTADSTAKIVAYVWDAPTTLGDAMTIVHE